MLENRDIFAGKRRKRTSRIAYIVIVVILMMILGFKLCSQELEVDFYHLYSPKVEGGETLRLIVLSDLHNREFGKGNYELVEKIKSLEPDIILMAGDMVNQYDADISVAVSLCEQLLTVAPVYFGLGNHEGTMIYEVGIPLDKALKEIGVNVLVNSMEQTEIKNTPVLIGSVSVGPTLYDQYSRDFVKRFEDEGDDSLLKLMISHRPSLYYEKMVKTKMDLAVCGHFHGGQIRIPFLGGVYSVKEGLFPKYCAGMYDLEYSTIFVSRGLGNNHRFPRINNRPELAVIDINAREKPENSILR